MAFFNQFNAKWINTFTTHYIIGNMPIIIICLYLVIWITFTRKHVYIITKSIDTSKLYHAIIDNGINDNDNINNN